MSGGKTVEWRDVVGYEGIYQVSSHGQVKSLARDISRYGVPLWRKPEQILKTHINPRGYLAVGLHHDGIRRECQVHRLVAFAFHGDAHFPGALCLHGDGLKLNNNADNLRWGNYSDNLRDTVKHGTHSQSRKTHCPKGHQYTPENTGYWRSKSGYARICRTCDRAREVARFKGSGISNAHKTHCDQGHPFDADNTYFGLSNGRPRRNCRACNREAQKRRAVRLRAARTAIAAVVLALSLSACAPTTEATPPPPTTTGKPFLPAYMDELQHPGQVRGDDVCEPARTWQDLMLPCMPAKDTP